MSKYDPIYELKFVALVDGDIQQQVKPHSMTDFKMNSDFYGTEIFTDYSATLKMGLNDMKNIIKFKDTTTWRISCKIINHPSGVPRTIIEDEFIGFFNEATIGDILSDDAKVFNNNEIDLNQDPNLVTDEVINLRTNDAILAGSKKKDVKFTFFSIKELNFNKQGGASILIGNKNEQNVEIGKEPMAAVYYSILRNPVKNIELYIDTADNRTNYLNMCEKFKGTFKSMISSIQRTYGIFKNGIVCVFYLGRLYIIGKYTTRQDKNSSIISKLNIIENASKMNLVTNNFEELDNGEYYLDVYSRIGTNPYNLQDGEKYGDYLSFTNYGLLNASTKIVDGQIVENRDPIITFPRLDKTHQKTYSKTKYAYDEKNNVYNANEYLRASTDSQKIVINGIRNHDPKMFAPHRVVLLTLDDKERNSKYGGKKVIQSVISVFKNTKATKPFEAICSSIVILNKCD